MKKKVLIVIFLVALTVINLIISAPLIIDACTCKSGDGGCSGNCCVYTEGACSCFDFGADDCTKLI